MGTGSARLTELADVQALERRFKVASMSEIIFRRDNVRLRTAEDIDNLNQRTCLAHQSQPMIHLARPTLGMHVHAQRES